MPRSKGCLDKKLCRGLLGDGMKSRRDILKSTKAILLGGTLLAVMAPAMPPWQQTKSSPKPRQRSRQ